jgi:hypothetical protein
VDEYTRTKLSCIFGTDDLNEVEKRHLEQLRQNTALKDLLREAVVVMATTDAYLECEGYLDKEGSLRATIAATLEKCKKALR